MKNQVLKAALKKGFFSFVGSFYLIIWYENNQSYVISREIAKKKPLL
jgi:hypothetical protein